MARDARPAVLVFLCASLFPVVGCGGGGGGGSGGPDPAVWAPTGPMATARREHSATLLTDGTVLVVGGTSPTTAELYLSGSGTFVPLAGPVDWRSERHTATRLQNSKVLIVGGQAVPYTAEVYDPFGMTFTPVAPPNVMRYGHVAVRLLDGRVLVAGGWDIPNGNSIASAEVYDPVANTWTMVAPMPAGRAFAVGGLVPSGNVVVAGGWGSGVGTSAVVYSPFLNAWGPYGALAYDYGIPTGAAPADGRITLVATGNLAFTVGKILDPGTGSWADAPPSVPHNAAAAVALEDGRVLAVGGTVAAGPVMTNACEVLDLASGLWSPLPPMSTARRQHTAVRLADGRVLVCGGTADGTTDLSSAEVIAP